MIASAVAVLGFGFRETPPIGRSRRLPDWKVRGPLLAKPRFVKRTLAAALLVLSSPMVTEVYAASPLHEKSYVIEKASAMWTSNTRRPRHPLAYSVHASRYEDLQTRTIEISVSVTRYKCTVDRRNEGLACGGGAKRFRTIEASVPTFDVADDLSSAYLHFVEKGESYEVSWELHNPIEDAADFLPGVFEYEESCPQGDGQGHGLHRRMIAHGTLFSHSFRSVPEEAERFWIQRGTLTTGCT